MIITDILYILSKLELNDSFLDINQILTLYNEIIDVNISAKDIFMSIYNLILTAKYTVDITFFTWNADCDAANLIGDAISNNKNNLRIRIIIPEAVYLKNSVVNQFHKTLTNWKSKGIDTTTIQFYILPYAGLGLWHTKFINIDNDITIITGANIQRFFNFKKPTDLQWFDISISIRGEVSLQVNIYFEKMLGSSRKLNFETSLESKFDNPKPIQNSSSFGTLFIENPNDNVKLKSRSVLPILILPKIANEKIILTERDTTDAYKNIADQGIIAALLLSKKSIRIMTPNLNDIVIINVLRDILHNTLIKIDILLAYEFNHYTSDLFQTGTNTTITDNMINCCDICRSAYKNNKLTFKFFSDDAKTAVYDHGKYANHGKSIFIDDNVSIITSQNLDQQSFLHSSELGVLIESEKFVLELRQKIWDNHWNKGIKCEL